MIVKDEEANLPDCLASTADLVDEIIVVDTGSTDRTKEVAASFGAEVFDFPWCDSFAAARNESLKHASGDWVFWPDADDRLDEDNRRKLKTLLAGLPDADAAYLLRQCRSPTPSAARSQWWTKPSSSGCGPTSASSTASTSRFCRPYSAAAGPSVRPILSSGTSATMTPP